MSESQHRDVGDLSNLPPQERARHYRELADMHLGRAEAARMDEARAAHLELAALWTRLATQADHQAELTARRSRSEDGAEELGA
jgi:hypothetical protein